MNKAEIADYALFFYLIIMGVYIIGVGFMNSVEQSSVENSMIYSYLQSKYHDLPKDIKPSELETWVKYNYGEDNYYTLKGAKAEFHEQSNSEFWWYVNGCQVLGFVVVMCAIIGMPYLQPFVRMANRRKLNV